MKTASILGTRIDCACGRVHDIAPAELLYGPDAIAQLPTLAARATAGRSVAVLADARTHAVAGSSIADVLTDAGWAVRTILLPDRHGQSPVCDDITRDELLPQLTGIDLLVPVGGGVLSDLAKWLSQDTDAAVVTFATCASMNGYTSANIAPTIRGVKSLAYGEPVYALAADPQILREAPYELTASGLGDVLAKSVSGVDWLLNHLLFDDYYCPASVQLVADIEPLYRENPAAVRDRKPAAIDALFDALQLTGVAMTMAGTSAPASGGEHLISHSLDMLASARQTGHDLHGRQVGVGVILASACYQLVLGCESPDWQVPRHAIDRTLWGPLADVVEEQFAAKRDRLDQAAAQLRTGSNWDTLRSQLAPRCPDPAAIRHCLTTAGAAATAADIGATPELLTDVLTHADEIRPRYTILDLARLVGILPGQAEQIIDTWAR
jgi:glycerol-1-phosphate dehydrogenase [NAD(P)+]